MQKKWGFSFPGWTISIVIVFVGLLTFGFLAPQLGFYWDDWAKTLVNILFGPEGYQAYYAFDRPLSGWTHILFTSLIGNNKIFWQYLNLFLRILAAIGMWWGFSRLWPKAKREIALVSVLYFVFPIFTQQPAAVTFHQQWLQAGLYFLGLGFVFLSLRSPKRYWLYTLIAIASNALQLTVSEYFFGMLLILPIFIFVGLYEQDKRGKHLWAATLRCSLPYLLLIVLYSLWRFKWMSLPVEDPYALSTLSLFIQQPLATLLGLGKTILLDLVEVLIGSWAPVFGLAIDQASSPLTLLSWALSLAISILLIIYFFNTRAPSEPDSKTTWHKRFFLIGLMALLAGLLPAWAIGKNVLIDFHANRYVLPGMFGAAFMLVAVISWFTQNWRRKMIVLSLLIGLAAGYHLREVNQYRWNWKNQTDFYWQLYWRAPKIEQKTAIVFEEEPFPNQGLFSTSSAINLLYLNTHIEGDLPYWAYTILPRYAGSTSLPEHELLQSSFRSLSFTGNTDDVIVTHYNPSHGKCWWILSADDQLNPYLSPKERQWAALSNLDRIEMPAQAQIPDPNLFGEQPQQDWCYFYEKAELAAQYEQWDQVADLGDTALAAGYQPEQSSSSNSPREWLPFILGYGMTEQLDQAFQLTVKNHAMDPKYQPMFCALWNKMLPINQDDPWRVKINTALNCSSAWESIIINLEP